MSENELNLGNLVNWQNEVKKPRKHFSREDALKFWGLVTSQLGSRVWRDGVSAASQILLDIGGGVALRVQAPSARTKLLVDVTPFDFDEVVGWEVKACEAEQMEDLLNFSEPNKKKQVEESQEEESILPQDEAVPPEEDWTNFASPTGSDIDGLQGQGDIDDKVYTGGSWSAEQRMEASEGGEKEMKVQSISSILRKRAGLKEMPKDVIGMIEADLKSGETDVDSIISRLEKIQVKTQHEPSFSVQEALCILVSLYQADNDSIVQVGSKNVDTVASQKIEIGETGKGETILLTKIHPEAQSFLVLRQVTSGEESYKIVSF